MSSAGDGFAQVPFPTDGVDPCTVLATGMHASPGVYAVLVGSGMSSAAGIPTGWQVVRDLIQRVARAEHVPAEEVGDLPEEWWETQGHGEPKYDELLDALAPTPAARQGLLRGYFDPPPPQGPIQPTTAHRALASLCAQGHIRVVLTTNFDRLLERALEDAGAAPQVIATVDGINGMTPLPHARTTVIKLHGDYASSDMRNTREELESYPQPLRSLLDRVLDEYGLLVIGWSAEHDIALADAISSCPSRRYPTYWAARDGHVGEHAQRLISVRKASRIDTPGADELLHDLTERVASLDRRAVQRRSPQLLRFYRHQPQPQASPPQGWATIPLLQLRAVAEYAPASIDSCGLIRPGDRDALVRTLQTARINSGLHALSTMQHAHVPNSDDDLPPPSPLIGQWHAPPDAHQSTDYATYRWGGDATKGVSALATVSLPGPMQGGSILYTLDIAISAMDLIRLGTAATLWRDGLVLVTEVISTALTSVAPPEAQLQEVEIHALASQHAAGAMTDTVYKTGSNSVDLRIDLTSLGTPSRKIGTSFGAAARVSEPLSERDSAQIVAELVEYIALANGFLSPLNGIAAVRAELGVSA